MGLIGMKCVGDVEEVTGIAEKNSQVWIQK